MDYLIEISEIVGLSPRYRLFIVFLGLGLFCCISYAKYREPLKTLSRPPVVFWVIFVFIASIILSIFVPIKNQRYPEAREAPAPFEKLPKSNLNDSNLDNLNERFWKDTPRAGELPPTDKQN
jgi:hypothetical protein